MISITSEVLLSSCSKRCFVGELSHKYSLTTWPPICTVSTSAGGRGRERRRAKPTYGPPSSLAHSSRRLLNSFGKRASCMRQHQLFAQHSFSHTSALLPNSVDSNGLGQMAASPTPPTRRGSARSTPSPEQAASVTPHQQRTARAHALATLNRSTRDSPTPASLNSSRRRGHLGSGGVTGRSQSISYSTTSRTMEDHTELDRCSR